MVEVSVGTGGGNKHERLIGIDVQLGLNGAGGISDKVGRGPRKSFPPPPSS